MKKRIKSIRIRTLGAAKVVALAAVMAFAVPVATGAPAASAQSGPWPEIAFRIGPVKFCIVPCYVYVAGFCCEPRGHL